MHPPSEDLFAYRDGELTPEKRAVLEAHVMGCSICRSFVDQVSSLEAELRQSPDRAPDGYLERLHESVRARIAVAPPDAVASAAEAAGAAPGGRSERRRSRRDAGGSLARDKDDRDFERERGRVKEAPSLPWAAIVATVSAAAAVMVVVVILIKQGPYRHMVMPTPRTVTMGAEPAAPGEEAPAPVAQGDAGQKKAERRQKEAAAPPERKLDEADADAAKDRLEKRADQVAKMARPEAVPEPAQLENAPVGGSSGEGTPAYQAILTRFGLPAVWDGARVSPEALASAEPELRSLYVSGGAGSDSAGVRLYLAEAARLRYTPGDSALHDDIVRHYRRAADLAGPGSEIARVAEDRLRTLEP